MMSCQQWSSKSSLMHITPVGRVSLAGSEADVQFDLSCEPECDDTAANAGTTSRGKQMKAPSAADRRRRLLQCPVPEKSCITRHLTTRTLRLVGGVLRLRPTTRGTSAVTTAPTA